MDIKAWFREKAPKDVLKRMNIFFESVIARVPIFSSLRTKLIVPYALLTLIVAMVGVFIITRLVSGSFEERFGNQLVEASRVTADGVVRKERKHLEDLRLLTFMDGVSAAIENRDSESLQATFEGIAVNNNIDVVAAIDTRGKGIITLTYDPEAGATEFFTGDDYSSFGPVQSVLSDQYDEVGDKFAGILDTQLGKFLFTSAPVRNTDEKLVGALLIGTKIDTLLEDLKLQALADILILNPEGSLVTTTLVEPEEGYGILEIEGESLRDAGLTSFNRELELYERAYEILYTPLIIRDTEAGFIGVVSSSEYIATSLTTNRNTFSIIFTLGTGAVILLGYLLAQHIARPILQLRSMSQAVAGGDLERSSGLERTDEIGELADAFDIMTLRLRERTEEAARLYKEAVQRAKELAEMNARLQATQAQLVQSEKLASVGQLTAGIVHDVKNPLAVIKGLAEELVAEGDLDDFSIDGLETIRDSASKANTIVTDLLKFARQSTPELQIRDMGATLESVFRLTEYLIRKGNVTLVPDLPLTSVMATYDAQQIEQVLINLVTNAVQAMPEGGTLDVSLKEHDDNLVITMRDSGVGIPEENLVRIFDPFFTTKPEGEGTGLGLSVSYGIISRHRGLIEVESEVGIGTTFVVSLPLRVDSLEKQPVEVEKNVASSSR
ncbi:MAG: HAMP domain-containing protein [Anaerolineales bacterium]|nr:MAG: HAMP domain-containing protein [Anaerolineales bacterium]